MSDRRTTSSTARPLDFCRETINGPFIDAGGNHEGHWSLGFILRTVKEALFFMRISPSFTLAAAVCLLAVILFSGSFFSDRCLFVKQSGEANSGLIGENDCGVNAIVAVCELFGRRTPSKEVLNRITNLSRSGMTLRDLTKGLRYCGLSSQVFSYSRAVKLPRSTPLIFARFGEERGHVFVGVCGDDRVSLLDGGAFSFKSLDDIDNMSIRLYILPSVSEEFVPFL